MGAETTSCTSAVPEVIVGGWVVLAEPLQDEFIVQQAVEGPEEEHVEGQVANSLLLKVSTESLHLPAGPEGMRPMFKTVIGYFKVFHLPCMWITGSVVVMASPSGSKYDKGATLP